MSLRIIKLKAWAKLLCRDFGLLALLALCISCAKESGTSASKDSLSRNEASRTEAEISALKHDKSPVTATIAGYAPRGVGSILGAGQARAIRKAYPGSNIVYEPGNPAGNIILMSEGKFPYSLNGTLEMSVARNGRPPFTNPSGLDLTAVTVLAPRSSKAHVYGRAAFLDKHGIRSIADIKKKKLALNVGVNLPGNIWVTAFVDAVLEEYGFTLEDIESWGGAVVADNQAKKHDLMKDRRLDLIFSGSYAPDGRVVELNRSTPLRFLEFTPEESRSIAQRLGVETTTIPANVYDFQPRELHVPVSTHMIVAGPAATFEDTYKFAKAMIENLDTYRAAHPALRNITVEEVVPKSLGLDINPGAAAYYKEVGLLQE